MNTKDCRSLWNDAFAYVSENEADSLELARGVGEHTFRGLRVKGFLREYCFVVYASGFKFRTVKDCFPDLAAAFHDFDLERLSRMRSVNRVLEVFGNERKARNFLAGAKAIAKEGFAAFKKRVAAGGRDTLMELPGIGPITKDHLAKNIGLSDVPKRDVWLERTATLCEAKDVGELVDHLSELSGETRHVVDVVLWIYGRDGHLPAGGG